MKLSNKAKAPSGLHCTKTSALTSIEPENSDDQTPPISPLRSPQLSSSSSSISSWGGLSSQGSQLSIDDGENSNGSSSSQCNSKDTYNTKFARYHLETYRQNDRMRWNFDFDHNRPLEDSHHHHHQTVPRYQWEPNNT